MGFCISNQLIWFRPTVLRLVTDAISKFRKNRHARAARTSIPKTVTQICLIKPTSRTAPIRHLVSAMLHKKNL